MSRRPNPLTVLGISTTVIEYELGRGAQGVAHLAIVVERAIRLLRQLYHPDVAGGSAEVSLLRGAIEAAAYQLSSPGVIRTYAKRLVDSASPQAHIVRELAEEQNASADRLRAALLGLVPFMDSAAVLCAEGVDVLLGYRHDLVKGDRYTFDATYSLRVEHGGLGMFYRLPHPVDENGHWVPMSYLETPVWNGAWQSEYMRMGPQGPELVPHVFRPAELFGARLVGGVSFDAVRRLAQRPQASTVTHELQGRAAPERPGDLTWYVSTHAWWMEAVRAPVNVGDFGVIVNDGAGLVALAGQILEIRMTEE